MSDQTLPDVEAIRARLDAATFTAEITFDNRGGDGEFFKHAPTDLRRLLDENARLSAENDDMRKRVAFAAAVISGDAAEMLSESLAKVRAELAEARSECDALAAKVDAVQGLTDRCDRESVHWRETAETRPGLSALERAEMRQAATEVRRVVGALRGILLGLAEETPEPAQEAPPVSMTERSREVAMDHCKVCGGQINAWESRVGGIVMQSGTSCGGTCGSIWPEWTHPAMPRRASQEAQERPETREGDTDTGTGVSESPGTAQAVEDLNSKHWLKWNTIARTVTGCQCGFGADEDSDCGFGDSVVAHLLEVGAARPVHYREAAQSLRNYAHRGLHPERFRAFRDAADLLDSTARDLDDEAGR